MTHLRALRWARIRWLSASLLIVIMSHALVPAGYMPGPDGLMLCPGYGQSTGADVTAMHDMAGMQMSGDAATPADPPKAGHPDFSGMCPFATAAFACSGPPTIAYFARADEAVRYTVQFDQIVVLPRTFQPSPLPRGPPSARA